MVLNGKTKSPSSGVATIDDDAVFLFLTESIADIDHNIAILQNLLSLYPLSHPEHINCVYDLALARWKRYQLLNEKEDLDKCIVHCTMAILLPPVSRDGLFPSNVFDLLFHLAHALLERSDVFEQPEGVKYSIECLRFLRGSTFHPFSVPRILVITSLVRGLQIQVKAGDGDGTQTIKEMLVLCRELLTSDLSAFFPSDALALLHLAADAEFNRGITIELLDEVVECLRDAVKVCPPSSYLVFIALVKQLRTRFNKTFSLNDYEEATALLENIVDPNRSGWCPDPIRVLASTLATHLACSRYLFFKNPEYLEVAISHLRAEISSPSIDEVLRFQFSEILTALVKGRFRYYRLPESLEEVNSQVVSLLSTQAEVEKAGVLLTQIEDVQKAYSLTALQQKIRYLEELLSSTPPGTERHKESLRHLADWYKSKFLLTKNTSDINESIKYGWLSLDATHVNDPSRIIPLTSLRDILFFAFETSGNISYLDKSITVGYDILELRSQEDVHFQAVQNLVLSLLSREGICQRLLIEDRREAIRLISLVINNPYATEPERFRLSCQWAALARSISHPTTLTAYKWAISLMQSSLSFAPTVSLQHTHLVRTGELCQTMPLDYASYQINLGQFEEAVETLEQGRALLWSEMRGLRISMARFIKEDSPLAQKFTQINQELEALTIAITPSGRPEIEGGVGDGTDPFGRLVMKRKKLVDERDALVLQIQSYDRSGFGELLRVPSFSTLRCAASRGPVIIINHCIYRSDIIIIFTRSLPCSIPTIHDFYDRANGLRDKLVEARKHGLDSDEYQDALFSVLKGLYELVGEPVIKRLRVLDVPEQSRIWWCPTSVFCSLPLHAMGPIPSSDPSKQYFSDFYIPSYTPSLSALIDSRRENSKTLEKPSLLLVAHPEDSLPGVKGEIKVIRRALKARVKVTGLISSESTPSSVIEGLRGSRFAHFACHGELETGKPFEASFKLHAGSRLTLLDIARSRLPDAEFAFLSCCHSAEITKDSIADEALHLTAAMQYCGFRSVVGTMWAMADTDGEDLAKSFYGSLFSSRETDVPYYERSAHALRDATQKLRRKRGIKLERWVNFVHYGA